MAGEAARDSAMEAGGTRSLGITMMANANANQSAIDTASLVGTAAPAPVSNAGRVGRALRGAAGTAPVFGDETAAPSVHCTNQGGTVTSSAEHIGGIRHTVTRNITGATPADVTLTPGEAPVTFTMSGEKPGGGWPGAELVSTVSGGTGRKEYALVFTDINPPAQSYNTTTATGAILDFTQNVVDTTGDGTADALAQNRSVITGEIPGDGSHFAGTFNANPTDNRPPALGRFFCPSATAAATGCSISVDVSGVLRSITGYEFQPVDVGSIERQDSDYLTWGVWLHVPNALQEPSATGLTNPATVSAFANGSDLFDVKAPLTGTATYNGVANGLYSAGGMVEYFDADASLTADFGGRTGNDSDPNDATANDGLLFGAVSGSITNIKAGGLDVDGSITLGKAKVSAATGATIANEFNGNTEGSLAGRALSGAWGGRFYGPNRAPDGSVAVRTEFPTTAAGTFGAATPGGVPGAISILGSFGAWKAD